MSCNQQFELTTKNAEVKNSNGFIYCKKDLSQLRLIRNRSRPLSKDTVQNKSKVSVETINIKSLSSDTKYVESVKINNDSTIFSIVKGQNTISSKKMKNGNVSVKKYSKCTN